MRTMRILGHAILLIYLYITACAFLFTVIRIPIFITFPRNVILYSYGMTAPYQSASAPHGQLYAECLQGSTWMPIDLEPYYPQIFGERNAREYFAAYGYSGIEEDRVVQRGRYAEVLARVVLQQSGMKCARIRISWDKWPEMTGPFDFLHVSTFTERIPLYGFEK